MASELTVIPTSSSSGLDCYLRWLSGAGAVSHDLYFGTNAATVTTAVTNSATYLGRLSKPHFDVHSLSPNTHYYVRVTRSPVAAD